jgi:hypothetical protein
MEFEGIKKNFITRFLLVESTIELGEGDILQIFNENNNEIKEAMEFEKQFYFFEKEKKKEFKEKYSLIDDFNTSISEADELDALFTEVSFEDDDITKDPKAEVNNFLLKKYNYIIKYNTKKKDIKRAIEIMVKLEDLRIKPNIITYSIISYYFLKNNMYDAYLKLRDAFFSQGLKESFSMLKLLLKYYVIVIFNFKKE